MLVIGSEHRQKVHSPLVLASSKGCRRFEVLPGATGVTFQPFELAVNPCNTINTTISYGLANNYCAPCRDCLVVCG